MRILAHPAVRILLELHHREPEYRCVFLLLPNFHHSSRPIPVFRCVRFLHELTVFVLRSWLAVLHFEKNRTYYKGENWGVEQSSNRNRGINLTSGMPNASILCPNLPPTPPLFRYHLPAMPKSKLAVSFRVPHLPPPSSPRCTAYLRFQRVANSSLVLPGPMTGGFTSALPYYPLLTLRNDSQRPVMPRTNTPISKHEDCSHFNEDQRLSRILSVAGEC